MNSFPTELFIDGELRHAKSGETIPQINPANEERFADVSAASLDDLDSAVKGAHQAYVSRWRDLTPRKRTDLLFAVAQLIRENRETLAQIECQNIGKPISD